MKLNLKPTFCVGSVVDITPELLSGMPRLLAVTFDLDRTLTGHHEEMVPTPHLATLESLARAGLRIGIGSNANSQARTNRALLTAAAIGHSIGADVVAVTSRMVGGRKKPLRPVFDELSALLDIPSNRIAYVGDQLLKDILGANLAGYLATVLVAPYGTDDDPRVRWLQRPVEAAIRPALGLPLLTRNFGR